MTEKKDKRDKEKAGTVSRAMILEPIAAWMATSNICRGMISFIFAASNLPLGADSSR